MNFEEMLTGMLASVWMVRGGGGGLGDGGNGFG